MVLLTLSAFTINNAISWGISDGYEIKFISKDPTGVFTKMDGEVVFDKNDLGSSKFDVTVDVNSINTGKGMQNRHAKGEKWFDAENYPAIRFVSDEISKTPEGYKAKEESPKRVAVSSQADQVRLTWTKTFG